MISLYDILEASNGQLFGEPSAQIFTDFCFDSSQAQEAQLFVALKTDRGDTHRYIREAVDNGVLGVLCTQPPAFDTDGLSIIIVKDTEVALMAWAHYVLTRMGTQVICVTGTSGKSLTVQAINRVLSTRYAVHTSQEGEHGRLSLPKALAHLAPQHKFIILEMDVSQPGEMAEMVQAIQPDVGVVTHISHDHTDIFASLNELVYEKQILIESLSPTGLAVLNYDDDNTRKMATATRARVLTVGMERFGADLMAYNILLGLSKTGFDLRYGSERFLGRWIPLLGKHHLYSVLSALAVGIHYDVSSLDEPLKALTEMPYLPGRMRPLNGLNNSLLIDDSHTANPESVLASLNWLYGINEDKQPDTRQRVIFVMGDMDHLGSYSQHGHRLVGQRAAEVADIIVTEGTDAALVGRAALDKGMNRNQVSTTYSVQDTIAELKDNYQITANDIVYITGGQSARMELVTQALLRDEADQSLLTRQDIAWDMAVLTQPTRLNWVEIDLNALASNVRQIKAILNETVALMAVVKADAYGHGAVSVARTALLNGAEYLAVGSMDEALELREAGIEAPILVLNYTPIQAVRQAIRQNITLTLYDLSMARAYERAAREMGSILRMHVKLDTGMGRLGLLADEAMPFFRHLINLHHLELEGIYTHFSSADNDKNFTAQQVRTFKDILKPLRASGFNFAYTHAANSAGTLASKENHFNMVRVGLAMYGLSPSETVSVPDSFQPVMSWKTVIAQVKTLPPGHAVGYGNTYRTQGEEKIAVIPVGFADGFRRAPNHSGEVLVNGQTAPIIGRVSMEKTVISVNHIPDVSIGDEVVLLGRQGDAKITVDDIARQLGTNNYEVVTSILPRVPRH